jgi:lauroyl/myristoyl acyltransferase
MMLEEVEACFDGDAEAIVAEAYRMALRNHLEELLLGKLTAETWSLHMRFEGQANLDAALARGKGVILLNPHAGNFMLMIASVSLAGYPFTQYAARGLAPENTAQAHPEVFGHNRFREAARRAREESEDRLPANFISLTTPVRHLYRCLENNEVVGLAFDGRIGSRFVARSFLGRQALLNPGAYRMAASTGAAIVPTLCSSPNGGPNVCSFAEAVVVDPRRGWKGAMEDVIQGAMEPWLRAHPSEYALWLAHCRLRAAVDDHPFFIDYAPDDRYKRHL